MTINPYEASTTANPPTAIPRNRFYDFFGAWEMLNAISLVVLVLVAVGYRLNWHYSWFSRDLFESHISKGFFSGLALIGIAGFRGLYFVFCRRQDRAVANGLLCVMGFITLIGVLVLVMEK